MEESRGKMPSATCVGVEHLQWPSVEGHWMSRMVGLSGHWQRSVFAQCAASDRTLVHGQDSQAHGGSPCRRAECEPCTREWSPVDNPPRNGGPLGAVRHWIDEDDEESKWRHCNGTAILVGDGHPSATRETWNGNLLFGYGNAATLCHQAKLLKQIDSCGWTMWGKQSAS